jgi:hypothetical protein
MVKVKKKENTAMEKILSENRNKSKGIECTNNRGGHGCVFPLFFLNRE